MATINLATKLQHHPEGQLNEMQNIQKLLTVIDTHILMQKPTEGQSIQLTAEEIKFVEQIKQIIHSSQKEGKSAISTLKKDLKGTMKELKTETTQIVKLNKNMKENEEFIKELEKQLSSANESLKNTSDLEEMLRMLGVDKKIETEHEHLSLKQKLRKAEQARDALLRQKDALDKNYSENSVRAFERVLADVTNEKNVKVVELTKQIDKLKDENGFLIMRINGATDGAIVKISCSDDKFDSQEFLELKKQKLKTANLEEELSKLRQDLEDAKSQKKEAILSLQQSKDLFNNKDNEDGESNNLNESDTVGELKKTVFNLEKQMEDKNKYCQKLVYLYFYIQSLTKSL